MEQYRTHRGLMEFQAETTALLAGTELGVIDDAAASESRGYVQHWLHGDVRPNDGAIRQVFSATDQILKAGRDLAQSA